MSRQPMGILASSPQLMTAAQKAMMQGQPMKAQTGASVNTGRKVTVSGQEYTINNQGVFDSRGAPVTNPNVISMIQKQNVIDAANPVSGMLRQFDIGDVNLSNALTDATDRKPIGQSEGGRQRSAALADAPGKIASGLSQGLGTIFDLPEATGPAPSPESPMGTKNKQLVRSRAAAAMGIQDDPALRPIVEQNIDESISQSLRNRPDPALGDEFGNMAPDSSMPSEILAATTSPPSKPQTGGDETTGDGDKPDTTSAATQNAITKLQQNLTNLQTGSGKTSKLSPDQATNQSVLDDFSYETAQFISPEEVDLNKVDQAAKDLMGFDPKAAGEKKETAFWMGLMKAGLAMAAGESENAITNIAKGLSYGLDSYGKDIALLNEQEREDRKEFRQLKVQMIKDERSYNIAQAGAQNTHNQHIADAKNRFTANKATLGIQEAKNIRDAEYQQANLALANVTLQNSIIKQINDMRQKDKEIEIKQGTLDATLEALTPPEVRALKSINYIDSEGNFTQKAIDAYGSEAAAAKAAIGGSSASKLTDEDDLSASYASRYPNLTNAEARILAADSGRFIETYGSIDEAIKELGFGQGGGGAAPAAPLIIADLPNPSVVAGKNPGDTIATKQGNYIVSSDGKSLIPTR
ncbi:MAG: hypothetical protein CMQ07_00405 [Gammaproteobacteria bacterium]|nr:hypothetical protein [Gammaproteobacteria bacterium]